MTFGLLRNRARPGRVAITGANGLVGTLCACALLADDDGPPLLLLVRNEGARAPTLAAIDKELRDQGRPLDERGRARIDFALLPPPAEMASLAAHFVATDVTEIVHAAGCLSYFNDARLEEGNQRLTQALLDVGKRVRIARFIYISSAYCCGYRDGPIAETLHDEPVADPNRYTRSKRQTEALVAASGVPYLILRPSVLIGDSRDGRYIGRTYGLYQFWTGMARFCCDAYRERLRIVAASLPANLLHQDAFQAGFLAAYRELPPGSVVHLVSSDAVVPTIRDTWQMWMELCACPAEVRYYSSVETMPRHDLDAGERLMLEFSEANFEISSRHWPFVDDTLKRLCSSAGATAAPFVQATRASVERCLRRFLDDTRRTRVFAERHRLERNVATHAFDGDTGARCYTSPLTTGRWPGLRPAAPSASTPTAATPSS